MTAKGKSLTPKQKYALVAGVIKKLSDALGKTAKELGVGLGTHGDDKALTVTIQIYLGDGK